MCLVPYIKRQVQICHCVMCANNQQIMTPTYKLQKAFICLHALVCVFVYECVGDLSLLLPLALPAAGRHLPNPVSSTLITWFLYNRLAGRNESLCFPKEMPSCSDSSLIQQNYRELHSLRFIGIQITRTIRATERATHSQREQRFLQLRSTTSVRSCFHSTVRE